jgi:hypothetical protein
VLRCSQFDKLAVEICVLVHEVENKWW